MCIFETETRKMCILETETKTRKMVETKTETEGLTDLWLLVSNSLIAKLRKA